MRAIPKVSLTKEQQIALNAEIDTQLAANAERLRKQIESIILWSVYQQFGCSADDLKQFADQFRKRLAELQDRYEMHDHGDDEWLCREMLRRIGYEEDPRMLTVTVKEAKK